MTHLEFFARLTQQHPVAGLYYARGWTYPTESEMEDCHNAIVAEMYQQAETVSALEALPQPATQKTNLSNASGAFHSAITRRDERLRELLETLVWEDVAVLREDLQRKWKQGKAREQETVYSKDGDALLARTERRDRWFATCWDAGGQPLKHPYFVRLGQLSAKGLEVETHRLDGRVAVIVTARGGIFATEWDTEHGWQPWRQGLRTKEEALPENRQGDLRFVAEPYRHLWFSHFPPQQAGLSTLPNISTAQWVCSLPIVAPEEATNGLKLSYPIQPYALIPWDNDHVVLSHPDHPDLVVQRPQPPIFGEPPTYWILRASVVSGETQYRPPERGGD